MLPISIQLPGYQITEQLYTGSRTLVYRGYQIQNQRSVVVKLLKHEHPSFSDLAQFRNQYTLARNLEIPSIIQPYSLESYRNGYALVMEDFGGISLCEWMRQRSEGGVGDRGEGGDRGDRTPSPSSPSSPPPLNDFFTIVLQLVETLHQLHQQHVVHKDVKPANILIHPETLQIKLIDFSIASLLPRETQEIQNPSVLEGTLAYLSPEQTGRMNRGIDYRSDFYSLGVTFFELLTGHLPFQSKDPMELVHCHLAKLSPSVCDLNPDLPLMLGEIILKLMAKNAEDRYQSAIGLKHDLIKCQEAWQATDKHTWFELGQRDVSDRFLIPEKLYGRESEVQTLLEAFGRAANGVAEMMLVVGFSGIGKTAVVNEVHKPIVRWNGYFIKGKFDQFNRNIPFSAFVQAFRDLMGQLLSESDAQLKDWKTQILDTLGENAQVIVDVVPELEKIVGKQPVVPELSGDAAQIRFNLLFQKFIQVFTTQAHPLVVFIDDLQWADSASLKLLQLLMNDTGYLLILGAYRDNEVLPTAPLMQTLNDIEKAQAIVNTITLASLDLSSVNQLIADTLSCDAALALPLTKLVMDRTQGNPFFTTQFLKALHEDGLITFNASGNYWECDIVQVRQLTLSDDVVEFMALQLQKLPQATQNVLKLAACIGNQFDLTTLAIASEQSEMETATSLWKALQEGLILPTSEMYKFFGNGYQMDSMERASVSSVPSSAAYRFLHDRVQQAAYSLIAEEQRPSIHLKLGQLLLSHTSDIEQDNKLFDIVNHLNRGMSLVAQPTEQEQIARLNGLVAQKARSATAYESALTYATTGIMLLSSDCWQSQYELTLMLHELATENAFLARDFEQMEHWAETVLQQAKTLLDQVKVYEIKLINHISQHQPLDALTLGKQVLNQFGIQFPDQPTQDDIQQEFQHTADQFAGRPTEELLNLPPMTNPEPLAAMRIAASTAPAVYFVTPSLYPLLVLSQVNASIQYGNAPLSAFFYACYGLLLIGILGDVEAADRAGKLALGVLERLNAREVECKTRFILGGMVVHGTAHLQTSLQFLRESYQIGLETGDIEFAGHAALHSCQYSYFSSQELGILERDIHAYSQMLTNLKQVMMFNYCQLLRQVALNLLGRSENPGVPVGDVYDEAQFLPSLLAANDLMGLHFFYLHKLILGYLFGDTAQSLSVIAAQGRQYLAAGAGFITVPIFYFYDSLAALTEDFAANSEYNDRLQQVAENQAKLQKWAHHAPMNHLHKWHLVEAEKQRVLGNKGEAADHYDRAISLAKEQGYLNEGALANELAARFYLEWGKTRIAQDYLTEAYYDYARWGAKAKVADLETRYPQLLAAILQQTRTSLSVNDTVFVAGTATSASSSSSISDSLDLAAILKASQILSSEIELDKLLLTLLHTVIQTAGAGKCVLMLQEDEVLSIKAIAVLTAANEIEAQMQPTPVPAQSSHEIPLSLIHSVKRSLQPVVISEAMAYPQFAADVYIQTRQPKSLFCSLILHQGKLLGMVYLENNLTVGAFTTDRVELLNLLCTQAAISLENARLYERSQQYARQLQQKTQALEDSLNDLQNAQLQIVQSEKMAALGSLVAGVAHEINNPVGFIAGNLQPALDYVKDTFGLIELYQQEYPSPSAVIQAEIEAIDLEYIRSDLPKLIDSMKLGVDRIRSISTSLRTFSRADKDYKVPFNIHEGIDSTILILKHRLKASDNRPAIEVITEYGSLPQIECFPGQLNQVFVNILANAIDALEETNQNHSPDIKTNLSRIEIRTSLSDSGTEAIIQIRDNGIGMSKVVKQQVFDHLFTTKGVGKGTGLGLAIVQHIIVEKHKGKIDVDSQVGQGATFTLKLPVKAD